LIHNIVRILAINEIVLVGHTDGFGNEFGSKLIDEFCHLIHVSSMVGDEALMSGRIDFCSRYASRERFKLTLLIMPHPDPFAGSSNLSGQCLVRVSACR